jgi:cytochrome c-type biogenesis protein CcmH
VSTKKVPDVSAALRELLTARTAGKISEAEFERRQAALHAQLLAAAEPAAAKEQWRFIVPAAIAVVVVLGGIGVYAWLGTSRPAATEAAATAAAPAARANNAQLEQQVKTLSGELAKNPMNGEAWLNLAHVYADLGNHGGAAEAYAKAAAILPPDAQLLSDWADSYVMSHNRQWDETSRGFIKRALAADPKHLKSLSLAATDAFDQKKYQEAMDYWRRMKAAAPNDASVSRYVDDNLAEATALMTGKPAPASQPAAAPSATAITGSVTIAARLKAKAAPEDTVFVIAKAGEGKGPPLAVKRYTVADLPAEFQLDDDAAMVPGNELSKVLNAVVVARVSKSGDPLPQPGDLESAAQQIRVGSRGVKLEIDTAR